MCKNIYTWLPALYPRFFQNIFNESIWISCFSSKMYSKSYQMSGKDSSSQWREMSVKIFNLRASWLFVQQFVQVDIKGNITAFPWHDVIMLVKLLWLEGSHPLAHNIISQSQNIDHYLVNTCVISKLYLVGIKTKAPAVTYWWCECYHNT